MEIRVIEYFLEVAKEKNITKAANALHVSQPTLSMQLRNLEEELGVVLFERGNRGISLSSEGELFQRRAREIMSLVSHVKGELSQGKQISGPLLLGGGESSHNEKIFAVAKGIVDTYENITVHYTSANADQVLYELDRGIIEFALVIGAIDEQKYQFLQLPWFDRWGLIGPTRVNQMEDLPLIISSQGDVIGELARHVGTSDLRVVGTYNLINNAILMAKSGIGYIVGFDDIAIVQDTDLVFTPLEPELLAPHYLIWKKGRPLSRVGEVFLQALQETMV